MMVSQCLDDNGVASSSVHSESCPFCLPQNEYSQHTPGDMSSSLFVAQEMIPVYRAGGWYEKGRGCYQVL